MKNNKEQNNLVNLVDLFNQKIYRVPDYQRGYSWELGQLKDFWYDILNVMESGNMYYTGMISFKRITKKEIKNYEEISWLVEQKNYKMYHIVDGQQRLTTIEILIKVILNYCENKNYQKLNDKPLEKIKEKYLQIPEPESNNTQISYLFGYEVDEDSDNYFKYYILEAENSPELNESIYTRNMFDAKNFFKEKLEELLQEKAKEEQKILNNLFITITTKLMFNRYKIDEEFNVFLAFEAMNNRGKKLSNLELLKNRLIYLSTLFNNIKPAIKLNTRNLIDKNWKEIYKQLGAKKDERLIDDEFLQAHWIIYFTYNRSKADAYSNFLLKEHFIQQNIEGYNKYNIKNTSKQNISKNELKSLSIGEINEYVAKLGSFASIWFYINNPDEIKDGNDKYIIKMKYYLNRIKRLGYGYFRPLLAAIYNEKEISNEIKAKIFYLIERYQFLQFRITGFSSSYENSKFYRFAHDIYKKECKLEETINELIKELEDIDYIENGIINSSTVKNFADKRFKNEGFYTWQATDCILYEYENNLKNQNREVEKILEDEYFKSDSKTVSKEHIYPQKPEDSTWIEIFKNYNEEEKKRFQGSLGNILPLASRINSQMQNYSFERKKEGITIYITNEDGTKEEDKKKSRRGYKEGSYSEQEVAKNKKWGPDEIKNRGLTLIEFIENEWQFKFKNEEDKLIFLGLEFMNKDNK